MGRWLDLAVQLEREASERPSDNSDNRDISPPIVPNVANVRAALSISSPLVLDWLARVAALDRASPPPALSRPRWCELLADAEGVLRQWGEQAVALGWGEVDLFSVPPGPERWGRGGLVMALDGRPVVAITAEAATIANPSGPPNRYYRRDKPSAVLLWDRRAFNDQDGFNGLRS